MAQEHITDEQLARLLQQSAEHALPLIYERYKRGLFLFSLRLLNDQASAEDVVHDTIVTVLEQGATLRNPSKLKSWIFMIARNEAFSLMKRRKLTRELTEDDEQLLIVEPLPAMEGRERSEVLSAMLDRLPPEYKEVLVLREFESLSYEEIAGITGRSISSVKSRLFRARQAMVTALKPFQLESAL